MKYLLDTGADLFETSGGSKNSRIGSSNAKTLPGEVIDRITEQDLSAILMKLKKVAENHEIDEDIIRPSIDTHDRRALEQCRRTALYGAASSGDAEVVRLMFDRDERGIIVNLETMPGVKPLYQGPYETGTTRLCKFYCRGEHWSTRLISKG